MQSRPQSKNMNAPNSPTLKPQNKDHLNAFIGKRISLKVLEWLYQHMQPHQKPFSIVDIALILQQYVQRQLKSIKDPKQQPSEDIRLTSLIPVLKLQKKTSTHNQHKFQLKRDQTLQFLLQQIKVIFLYWGRTGLSYQMINQYIYNQQLRSLYSNYVDEDYMQIGEKRVRIDENLKLCILPLANFDQSNPQNRNRDIIFRENKVGAELQTVYAVTRESIRALHIRTQLIGIASDYDRKGSNNSCWYKYQQECIKPKRETILNQFGKNEQKVALTSAEQKQIRQSKMTNLQQMIPSHRLQILKAQVCNSSIGIICMDQSFIIQPLGQTNTQGYIGNLMRDIPPVVAYKGSKDVYQQVLKLHSFGDNSWLILTQKFIYKYQIPSPSQNVILSEQNNAEKLKTFKPNPLLLLCQRLPAGCIRAEVLGEKHVALMLVSNCIVIIQLVINNKGILSGNTLSPSDNYYKITNKIYNDIQFKAICYNPLSKYLFLSDFGAFIIRLTFSPNHGDIQQQGPTHDKQQNQELNRQLIKNSYIQLKASRGKIKQSPILEMEEEYVENEQPYVEVYYIKGAKQRQHQHLLTLYKKQNKSPHTVIIKNQSRQNITLIATSPHYNTLITYQSESVQKSALGEYQGEKYKQWGNQNKIKLWDARHMTIYQTLNITIEATCIHLRSNGLYFLTTQKGYLGFYQFNQDKKAIIGKTEQRLLDKQSKEVIDQLGQDIILQGGVLFYTTCLSTFNKFNNTRMDRTYLSSCSLEKYPESLHLQTLPSEINSIAVKQRIYILQNSRQGVQASQLHIYNRLGLKEEMLIFSNHEDIDVATGKVCAQNFNQEFKMIKKLSHEQFEVVLWNSDSLRLLGLNRQLSLTLIFNFSKKAKSEQVEKTRQIKNIEVNGVKMLVYYEQRIRIPQTNVSTVSFSTTKELSPSKQKNKRPSKYRESSHHSIAIFNCQTDRLIYQLQRISHNIKILHVYNSILLTRQKDPLNSDYDLIRVLDIAQHGQLIRKYLFSVKVMRQSQKITKMSELKEYHIGQVDQQKNKVLQQIKQFVVKRHIQIEDSKIAVSQSNKLLLILVFRIETQIYPLSGNNLIKSQVHFMIYTRNISDELMNKDYKISRIQIGKKMKRNIQEFQTSAGRNEDISDHKQLTFQQLCSMSNFAEIDMQLLCEQIQQQSGKIPTLDLTPRLLSPHLITTSRTKDTFQLISVNSDQSFCKVLSQSVNKISALSNLTFKVIQYDQQKLVGVAVVSSKSLKSMILYKVGFDCSKAVNDEDEPYRVDIKLQKFAVLQALSPIGKVMGGQTLRIIEWNKNYKTEVDKLWDKTFNSIANFLKVQRQEKLGVKSPIKQVSLITNQFKLPTLKIRKAQILKRKLQYSERSKDNIQKSPRYMKTLAEQADDLSMMFKKWSISQSITRERQQLQNNNRMIESKMNNKELNKILKNENERTQRIKQLISVSRQIKDISDGALDESKYSSPSPKKSYSYLQNVIKSSEVANKNTLKSYLQQKKAVSRNTNQTNTFNFTEAHVLTRTETNQSRLQSEITKIESNNEPRIINTSKLSMYTNFTKKSTTNGKKSVLQKTNNNSPNTLQSKLSMKLQQIQKRSQSEYKQRKNLDQTAILKRTQSTKKNSPKNIISPERLKKQSSNINNLPIQSPIRISYAQGNELRNTDSSKKRYKTQQSVNFNFDLKKVEVRERLLTENHNKKSQANAIEKMKQSQTLLKSHILPEILSTKEKLNKKMKEKRSYVKIVQDCMQESNLQVINNATQRKHLVSKLLQFK